MLSIITDPADCILFPDDFFIEHITPDELTASDKTIIREIDRADFVEGSNEDLRTPFGLTDIYHLSTGVKTLIDILHFPDKIFNISGCGPNAVKILYDLAKDKDITVQNSYIVSIPDGFERIKLNGTTIENECRYFEWWEKFDNGQEEFDDD